MSLFRLDTAARAISRAVAADSIDRQPIIAEKWHRELMAGFLNGTLCVLDSSDMAPIRPERPGAVAGAVIVGVVTRDELNRWLSAQGFPLAITEKHFAEAVVCAPSDDQGNGPTVGLSWRVDPYWIKVAHDHASRIAQRNIARGYGGTSQRDVMSDVAAELQKDSRFPALSADPQTIRRVLLNGWRWRHTVVAPTARPG